MKPLQHVYLTWKDYLFYAEENKIDLVGSGNSVQSGGRSNPLFSGFFFSVCVGDETAAGFSSGAQISLSSCEVTLTLTL